MKSPKLYVYDTGLLCYLLGIEDKSQLERDPLYGSIFENLIINELLKSRFNKGMDSNGYFLRDSNGLELDYIIPSRRASSAYEFKSSMTYNKSFSKALDSYTNYDQLNIKDKYIVYRGETIQGPNNIKILNIFDFLSEL